MRLQIQNLPARLRAASAAEILDRPLAVPEAPELSVPNGFTRPAGRSRNIDCVPTFAVPAAEELKAVSCVLLREIGAGECIDCERFGVPSGELDQALGCEGSGECGAGAVADVAE